jgi:predicted transcriptional regulator
MKFDKTIIGLNEIDKEILYLLNLKIMSIDELLSLTNFSKKEIIQSLEKLQKNKLIISKEKYV